MKLTLQAFRGASQPFALTFKKSADLTIIYGENGSGKTTISDAFEFLFHSTSDSLYPEGSLHEKSLDGKNKITSLVNLQSEKAELSVTWEAQNQLTTATIAGAKPRLSSTPAGNFHTLCRKRITRLVEEKPTERFKRIQEFVSLPALDREEGELRKLILQQEKLLDRHVGNATRIEEELTELHLSAHPDNANPPERNAWFKTILSESDETKAEHLNICEDLDQTLSQLRSHFTSLKEAFEKSEQTQETVTKSGQELTKLVTASSDQFAEALATLQEANSLFEKTTIEACPLCDTPQSHEELAGKVTQKLANLNALILLSKEHKKAEAAVQQAQTILTTLQDNTLVTLQNLAQIHQAAAEVEEWTLPSIPPAITAPQQASEVSLTWFQLLTAEAPQLKVLGTFVTTTKEELHTHKNRSQRIRSLLVDRAKVGKEGEAIELFIQKAKAIETTIRQHRIQYANDTLEAISGDFAELYRTIHPGEDLETIKLYLHPTKKGAAQFDGSFFGKDDISPVACLSESHLDTLGLCLFLALQKRENPADTIVYLDDAIASVDEVHMERLYELLLDQAQHFKHLIISSHYQPLRFKFRWGLLTQKKVNFVELGRWTPEQGLNLAQGPTSEVAYLRRYLDEGTDATTIASKSGIVLERVLDFLTGIYQCSLPRNPGAEQRWTLDNYKTGLKQEKKLLAALRCDHLDDTGAVTATHSLAPLLEDIFDRLQFRNAIGCHYKELTSCFDEIGEACKLGRATLALVDALCDEKDQLPEKRNDGESWHNSSPISRRLFPLTRPR